MFSQFNTHYPGLHSINLQSETCPQQMTPKQSDTCLVPQLVGGWGWKFCPLPDPGSLAGVRAQGLAALGLVGMAWSPNLEAVDLVDPVDLAREGGR